MVGEGTTFFSADRGELRTEGTHVPGHVQSIGGYAVTSPAEEYRGAVVDNSGLNIGFRVDSSFSVMM